MNKITLSRDGVVEFLGAVVAEKFSAEGLGGTSIEPRPSQAALAADVFEALSGGTAFSGIAPAGTGKSFAYLSVAALLVARTSTPANPVRVLVSTELIGLQQQLVQQDLPVVQAAAQRHLGIKLSFAALSGANNYVDPARLMTVAEGLLQPEPLVYSKGSLTLGDLRAARDMLLDHFNAAYRPVDTFGASTYSPAARLAELVLWGLDCYVDRAVGDDQPAYKTGKDSSGARWDVPVEITADDWALVSAGSDDRSPAKTLEGFNHLYDRAKQRAGRADIVVVNHSLLGIEAVSGGGIVMGNEVMGEFDHVIVDEAHALPSWIRKAGSKVINHNSFKMLGKGSERFLPDGGYSVALDTYGKTLDSLLGKAVRQSGSFGELSIEPADRGPLPAEFIARGCALLQDLSINLKDYAKESNLDEDRKAKLGRLRHRVLGLYVAYQASHTPQDETATTFLARWVSQGLSQASLEYTPVSVDTLARNTLWTRPGVDSTLRGPSFSQSSRGSVVAEVDPDDGFGDWDDDEEAAASLGLAQHASQGGGSASTLGGHRGVVCLSATLPVGFGAQIGVEEPVEYPSPFAQAMYESSVYIVSCPHPEKENLMKEGRSWNGRPPKMQFDTSLHPAWAARQVVELVAANSGRALVLSATAAGVKIYAEALRARLPKLTVYSQYDTMSNEQLRAAFQADESSVLVGTRSFMTGIDISGEGLSLLVLDRPPRERGTTLSDARVAKIMREQGLDKFAAQRLVYVSDVGALVEQACGRLIRSMGDRGMVAILDPRLGPFWPAWTSPEDREVYIGKLRAFGTWLHSLDEAKAWLANRRYTVLMSELAAYENSTG